MLCECKYNRLRDIVDRLRGAIYALKDDDLGRLIDDWVASKRLRYPDSERFSGLGDMGRDVAG